MDLWGISDAPDRIATLWRHAVVGLLAHHADTGARVTELLRHDPCFVPAIALEACGLLFKGRRALRESVRERIVSARSALAQRPNAELASLVDALDAWNRDATTRASSSLASLRARAPGDPLLAKLQHGLLFMTGDSEQMLGALADTRDAWMESEEGRGYIRGCLAFALEENGRFDEAEREGRAAVDAQGRDAWGIHAVAHVMGMHDRVEECISWLDRNAAGYAECGIFKRHVYWHWALLHLERGEIDAALHLYDRRVCTVWVGDYRDMSNQATLLWRMEREGVDVGDRWDALVAVAEEHARDHGSAFADAHYAMPLARSRDDELLESLRAHIDRETGDQVAVQREVGAPLCQLVFDVLRGAPDLDAFAELAPRIRAIGGSLAQREIFELMRIEAALDACSPMAFDWLAGRARGRPHNAWTRRRLDQIRQRRMRRS